MSSELKRKGDDSKRSVFDRLGPDTKSITTANSKISIKMPSVCPSYAKTGYCQLGLKCKYEHVKKDKDKDDYKNKLTKKDKDNFEKINNHPKESEAKLKSAIVPKSSDISDKKSKKVSETKSIKSSGRSVSPGNKKKPDDNDQVKQKEKRNEIPREESRDDQKHIKTNEKMSNKSTKHKKSDHSATTRNSSTSSKKTADGILSPPSASSKDGKIYEAERLPNKEVNTKSHSKNSTDIPKAATSKHKPEHSRKEEKKEMHTKPKEKSKDRKDVKYDIALSNVADASLPDAVRKIKKQPERNLPKSREVVTKKRQRSISDSTSSSSSSGSSSSSSGSSSGSSSQSSCSSQSPIIKQKKKGDKKTNKLSSKQNIEQLEKPVVKKLEGGKKPSSVKQVREYSEDRSHDKTDDKIVKSKHKVEVSKGSKRECSASPPSHYNSPPQGRGKEDHYFSSRKADEERYARAKMHDPEYKIERDSLERPHESRRVKTDQYPDKMSPGVEARRKESDYYRGEEFNRYRRGVDDDYDSLERRKPRERPLFDLPDKEVIYSEESIRRDRLSRRGQWEQMEVDNIARNKHKRHLSNESFSPPRKKNKSTPHEEYRERNEKVFESEGRKRDYEREDDSFIDDMTYKAQQHRRRSSHDSWNQHSKERRTRKDKSDHDRSREEKGRDDYYARSPIESSDYSPRHRPEHSKRSGDYPSYDYDVERGRRSLSRSSRGSKPPGRSRYYEGKRSLGASGGSMIPPHFPSSFEFRDSYRATPDTDVVEGRPFQGKPLYWDEYKRTDEPPTTSSYRGVPTLLRSIQPSSTGVPSDWESGRIPGKQQPHDWDNRFEKSSEEFISRRDVLLPPPPRPRHENSEVTPVVIPAISSNPQFNSTEVFNADTHVLKAMTFELEGYENIEGEDLDECLEEEEEDEDGVGEKDGIHVTYDDEGESLPKKIPLVDMSDIEWEILVKADDNKVKTRTTATIQKFSDIIREIGVSRHFAGDELFERINNMLVTESNEKDNYDGDIKVTDDNNGGGGGAGKQMEDEKVVNGLNVEEDTKVLTKEPEANGEITSILPNDGVQINCELKDQTLTIDSSEGKENKVSLVKTDNFESRFIPKISSSSKVNNKHAGSLFHDVANFHVTAFLKWKRQSSALKDIGPYRRGLCARRDLAIRRTLCRIEKDEIVMFPAQLADQELYKLSLQLFNQNYKTTQETSPAPLTLA